MSGPALVAAAGLALAFGAGPARAQMIGEELAAVLEALGCSAEESQLAERFKAEGFDIGDYQAQATALMRGGYLVAGERQGELRLVGWGECG